MKDKLLCQGYVRADGSKGIRNKVLVIYTVECCRALSERIARHFQELGQDVEAVGTSSCLDNQADIRRLLRFSTHPNVGAVLAIGHGCEYTKPQKIARAAVSRIARCSRTSPSRPSSVFCRISGFFASTPRPEQGTSHSTASAPANASL